MYTITEYIGDYPLEDQKLWMKDFSDLESAEEAAISIYKEMVDCVFSSEFYRGMSKGADLNRYHVIVQNLTIDENGGREANDTIVGFTAIGRLVGAELETFLSTYDD